MDAVANYRWIPPLAAALRPEAETRARAASALDPKQTVREPARAGETRADTRERRESGFLRPRGHDLDFDPDSDSLVYRAYDPVSGQMVTQIPADSLLKLRAYLREQEPAPAGQTLEKDA